MQDLHPNTLECPCSQTAIPFNTFISFAPTFHQVCSSNFVADYWISLFMPVKSSLFPTDWRFQSFQRFQLLATLCKLAKTLTDDAVRRFKVRSFVTANVLTEDRFNAQLETIITQLIQSTNIDYNRLFDIIHLVTQVDQHFAGQTGPGAHQNFNARLIIKTIINETNWHKSWQVLYSHFTHPVEIALFHNFFLFSLHFVLPVCQISKRHSTRTFGKLLGQIVTVFVQLTLIVNYRRTLLHVMQR
jgi:hypothetical protein